MTGLGLKGLQAELCIVSGLCATSDCSHPAAPRAAGCACFQVALYAQYLAVDSLVLFKKKKEVHHC